MQSFDDCPLDSVLAALGTLAMSLALTRWSRRTLT